MGWLDGKVALVAGAGSGIGRAVVDGFREEGARVGVLEIDEEKCAALEGLDGVHAIRGDATRLDDEQRSVDETLGAFGRLDTLATFVGVFDYYLPLEEIPAEALTGAYAEMFEVNVGSCLLAAKAALPALSASLGSILLTTSTSGFYPGRGGPLYVASKFAVRGLVVQLAHELAPRVRVNGVAPGGTLDTELRGLRSVGLHERRLGEAPGREEDLRANTPLDIAMRSEDHAGAYIFLASERARGITGSIVNSDGGVGVKG